MRRAIARGRVFPQSYSTDRRYGRLSLKAIALFPLMWANSDDQGRLSGDPEEIKYAVCPNVDHITKKDIPELLKELEDNKLILIYPTPKSVAIQMLDWWEIHRPQWAWPSEYSPPEGWKDRLRYKKGAKEVVTQNWAEEPAADKLLYFVLDEESDAIKIGITDSPEERLKHLQASSPHTLKLIKVIENADRRQEQELFQRFSAYSIDREWFHFTEEIQRFVSGESSGGVSGESSGGVSGETAEHSPLTTPVLKRKKKLKEETERGRGNSPEDSGEKPPPSPTGLSKDNLEILHRLTSCFKKEWGRVPAESPDKVIPREPNARESAQLRDLAKELSAVGCPLDYITQAFRDAAGRPDKMHVSYVGAILRQWLGIEKGRPP